MSLDLADSDFLGAMESCDFNYDMNHDFLNSLPYANEAWFALEWERPLPLTAPAMTPVPPLSLEKAAPAPIAASRKVSVAVLPKPQPRSVTPEVTAFLPLPPLSQPMRSASSTSVETSPDAPKARALPRPISPKSSERRRLRTFSSSDSSSNNDDSSDDGSVKKSKKRVRTSAAMVTHTSVFRGVSCCGKDRKFQARIRDGSKVHYLGRFDNEFDAAVKYDEAARSHKGDSAAPNFVEMSPAEVQQLRSHYFANGGQILPEFYRFLNEPTIERLEVRRNKRAARGRAVDQD